MQIPIRTSALDASTSTATTPLSTRPRRVPVGFLEQRSELGPKLVLVLVGLPARGKSYISKKLSRYLSWLGLNCRVFNVGNRRRTAAGATEPGGATTHDARFFDTQNEDARRLRDQLALDTLEELLRWLQQENGKVAIHDATNSTVARRQLILDRCAREGNLHVIFIESICTDARVIEANVQMKLQGPDYVRMDSERARQDFVARMKHYERAYEPIGEAEEQRKISYIKLINVGSKVIANNIKGYLGSQCVFYLMNIHIKNRTLWLSRHGESEFNLTSRIGGDPSLTPGGRRYAAALTRLLQQRYPPDNDYADPAHYSLSPVDSLVNLHDPSFYNGPDENPAAVRAVLARVGSQDVTSDDTSDSASAASAAEAVSIPVHSQATSTGRHRREHLIVYTSLLRRTIETVAGFAPEHYEVASLRSLNEIDAGMCEKLTYDEIRQRFPEEFHARQRDKLNYRYPGPSGESYLDVIERLRPTIVELERLQSPCLVVTHRVVLRALLAYFCGLSLDRMTRLHVPLHTVYRLRPRPYGTDVLQFCYNEETDSFDERPFEPLVEHG